jgi:hypothetical protein
MQRLFFIIGGIAILASSFLGTLYLRDSVDFRSMDVLRVEDAKTLKAALERYHAARGKYPAPFPNNDVADLKSELVDGGFIAKLPVDPYWKNGKINKYRYRSDGSSYGLLFYLELGPCLTGIGPAATGVWDGRKITTCAF